jgi:hypothetical protein
MSMSQSNRNWLFVRCTVLEVFIVRSNTHFHRLQISKPHLPTHHNGCTGFWESVSVDYTNCESLKVPGGLPRAKISARRFCKFWNRHRQRIKRRERYHRIRTSLISAVSVSAGFLRPESRKNEWCSKFQGKIGTKSGYSFVPSKLYQHARRVCVDGAYLS